MRRLVTWEDVEELAGVAHRKREDQPIWFSSRERGLGCGRGGVPIAQSEIREAGEQMRFDESVRREAGGRRHALSVSEDSQRRGRVSLGQADRCVGEVNGVDPFVFGGELVERCARLIWHSETSEPFGDHRREDVHTAEQRLRLHGGGQRLECRPMLPATGVQHARDHVQQHLDSRVDACLDDVPAAAQPTLSLLELALPHRGRGDRPERGREHRAIAQAVALAQGERLTTALACLRERDER